VLAITCKEKILNGFSFYSPTKVVFGADTVRLTGREVKTFGGTKALVLYGGGSAVRSGALDIVTESLAAEGIGYLCVGGIQPNPLAEYAQQITDDHRDAGIDFVIGVGGGSVIDTAKSVAHGLKTPDIRIWDYHIRKEEVIASLPVGAVVTFAATGSETSDSSVLTHQATGIKRGINTDFNRPRFAIMDPTLTYSLPLRQTVCGITDILMHTLDRYFVPGGDNAVTDALSEALMRVVIKYGKVAIDDPVDYKARSELLWAGSLSHNGLTGLGRHGELTVHQLGSPLSAKYDTPHGESLSALWASWARYVYRVDVKRFARYAGSVWDISADDDETAAVKGIAATEDYFRAIGMPVTLTEAVGGNVGDDIEELAEICTFKHTRNIGVLKVLDFEAIKEIYLLAL